MEYRVVKYHTAGVLKGFKTVEYTTVKFDVGKQYLDCITGVPYIIIANDKEI